MITYRTDKQIADKDLRPLYTSVEWAAYTNGFDDLEPLLAQCTLVISAWNVDELVGLIRAVGDGYYIQYIQDLLVKPEYQNQGIGTALLSQLLEKSQHCRQVLLMTDIQDVKVQEWYKRQGLVALSECGTIGLMRK